MNSVRHSERFGYLMIFLGGALWGTIGIFIIEMEKCGSDSAMTSFLRIFFAFLILAVITLIKCGAKSFLIDKKTLITCILLGLICQGIYNVFYSLAVSMTGVAISSVLLCIAPVFTLIASVILFREKLTLIKSLALIVNIAGCILAATGGSFSAMQFSLAGILFGVASGFCYSLTAIIGRLAANQTNPFVMSTYSYLFAAIFLGIFAHPWKTSVPVSGKLILIGFLFALIPTSIAYLIYYYGLQMITESSKVPVIASVETVIATILGILIYHEKIQTWSGIGILLVLVSIVLMNHQKKR